MMRGWKYTRAYIGETVQDITRVGVGRSKGHSKAEAGRDFRSTSEPTFIHTVRAQME